MQKTKSSGKKFWEIKAAAEKTGEIYIYGRIVSYIWSNEDITATSFKKELEALGDIDTLDVYINSSGGNVFQAQAIYSILSRHSAVKNAYIDGLAASAASFLIMAADKIYMPKNATMMAHYPLAIAFGNAKTLRKEADALDKIAVGMIEAYMSHIGDKITEDKLKELLDAETWLTAQEAFDYGLADEIIEAKEVTACVDPELFKAYKNAPESLLKSLEGGGGPDEKEKREKIAAYSRQLHERVAQTLKF